MASKLTFDVSAASGYLEPHELAYMQPAIRAAHRSLEDGTGPGSDFRGWVTLPTDYDRDEFQRILDAAERIRSSSEVLVVIGIGGSYLGARAVIDALSNAFHNQLDPAKRPGPAVVYAGNQLSGRYMRQLLDFLEGKDFSINVISKSGTTTEPAVAFRILRDYAEKRYGVDEARRRIYATTDRAKGALKQLADEEGYETFVVPDDVGGRYSVLTAVGLLPIAAAGIDIQELMAGAAHAQELYRRDSVEENPCYQYVAARHSLNRKGKVIELLVNYDPGLHYVSEWWKQLFGESEGKDGKGLFPASVDFTTDLHSMGQYIQEGVRHLFETVIHIENGDNTVLIPSAKDDRDGLDYLVGKSVDFVNESAYRGTLLAHADGGVPSLVVSLDRLTTHGLGHLLYFFEKACGVSGYVLGVNTFDQPGVEAYKKNMFALLGKPGYEKQREALLLRLARR